MIPHSSMACRKAGAWARYTEWIIVAAGSMALLLMAQNNHGLFEPDEGRYASMALEWLEFHQHDWLEPMLSDCGHYDKPPLIYWMTGASILVFGKTEFAVRFPSILGGMMTLAGVGLLAGRQYGSKAAFGAVFACVTTIHFWALTHLLSPDMLLCGFCTLGAALVLWGKGKTPLRSALIWACGACCWILAWWTKATAALVPLIAIYASLWIGGRKDLRANLRFPWLLGAIFLGGAPWYLIMMKRHPELVDFFFFREAVGRIAGHADGRRGFFGYHFAVAAVFWLPWWPMAALRHFRETKGRSISGRFLLLSWEARAALIVILIYSLVSSKLITYILPGVPFAMVAAGSIMAPDLSVRRPSWHGKTGIVMVVAFVLTAFLLPHIEHRLGRNSSLRLAIEAASDEGADVLLLDRHFPGAEFYFNREVWYVGVEPPRQVNAAPGQVLGKHFVPREEVKQRIQAAGDSRIWLIRWRAVPEPWELDLAERAKKSGFSETRIGSFHVSRVR